jgi:hypothetical protein
MTDAKRPAVRATTMLSARGMSRPLLQRKCACGQHNMGEQCDECKKKHSVLQRRSVGAGSQPGVPAVVHEVLRSPGQALDGGTRAFLETRFGRDFSRVRVHTDPEAAQSAASIYASAYTVGEHLVFNRGQYAPNSSEGRRLIAHELAHVVQQSSRVASPSGDLRIGATDTPDERAADETSLRVMGEFAGPAMAANVHGPSSAGTLQRQPNLPGPAPTLGGLDLSVDLERGSVSVTVSGPSNTPVVSKPTIGLRRDASGSYHMLVGGKDKVITVDEIPGMLRKAVGAGGGAAGASKKFRIPTCHQLHLSGKERMPRYMTFDQYKLQQRIWHGAVNPLGGESWLDLTEPLFDELIALCSLTITRPLLESPGYNDAPGSTLPKGSAYA